MQPRKKLQYTTKYCNIKYYFILYNRIVLVIHLLSCLNVIFFVIKQHQIKCGRWKEKNQWLKKLSWKNMNNYVTCSLGAIVWPLSVVTLFFLPKR